MRPIRMKQHVGAVTLIVRDYDAAIAFYTQKPGFTLVEDVAFEDLYGNAWDLLQPK